ncbi:MAG TPA: capreomycidine synthase [Longimicrobium sp.]|nr:capreomycidine synthase [Longimicrobium sp.]
MRLPPALLEEWMRQYYFDVDLDIGSSGVDDYSMADLRRLIGFETREFDDLVFRDSQTMGGDGLRDALARRFTGGDVEKVMATHGSSEANFLLMLALLSPGDEVVVLDPCYPQLFTIAQSIGCTLRRWPLRWENAFAPDLDDARALIGPRTRMIIVNFPHNPTGATMTAGQQAELIELAARHGAYLVWDGAFTELVYDAPPLPEPVLAYERAISMGTFSKAYGLPGLRVGWALAHPAVFAPMMRVRDYVTLHLSPMVERLAERVVRNADALIQPRLALARHNRAIVGRWVEENAELVEWALPAGGVTGFPRFPLVPDVEAFCHELARKERVLLVPGSAFGHAQHVRLGFGRDTAELEEALARTARLLAETAEPALA